MKIIDSEIQEIKNKMLNFKCESIELEKILINFLNGNSKFIRSTTAILFFKSQNYTISEEQFKILHATEIIHNASLIHDDVIDGGVLRRGKKTINIEFDNKLSVIAGDYLISQAITELLSLNNNKIINIFTNTISKMCLGESLQYFSKGSPPTIQEYLLKTQYKTAELFNACFASLCEYSNVDAKMASEFALNYGIAFQIKNDLNDHLTTSNDLNDNIYNVPSIVGVEKTMSLIDNYCNKIKECLVNIKENEYKEYLIELVDELCN